MIIVLHTLNLEPITVVDIPIDAYQALMTKGLLHLRVEGHPEPVRVFRKEVLFDTGDVNYIFIADNEELALIITPACLPGQHPLYKLMKGFK